MIRKLLTSLLCLLLAAALPMAALADTRHTLTILPGDELAGNDAVKDLFEALSLSVHTGDKSGGLSLSLGDTEIATAAVGVDSTALYVHSSLLGDEVYYITWDDGFAVASDLLALTAMTVTEDGEVTVDEEALAAMQQTLEGYKTQIVSLLSAGGIEEQAAVADPEEALAKLEEMFPNDPAMLDFYKSLFEKMTFEEGDFTDPERDAATHRYSMTMTGEDFAAICDTQYMRNAITMAVQAEDAELEGDELDAAVEEALETVRSMYTDNDIAVEINAYATDGGETLVGMDMGMAVEVTEDGETTTAGINFNYDRLTGDNGVDHVADMSMTADGEEILQAVFQLQQGVDGVSDGMLAMLASEVQITFAYHAENQGDDRMRTLELYGREDATAIIEPAASDRPILSFELVSGPDDSGMLDAIDEAPTETSVDVMKLSNEELDALYEDAQNRVNEALFTAFTALPDSVIDLIFSNIEFDIPEDEALLEDGEFSEDEDLSGDEEDLSEDEEDLSEDETEDETVDETEEETVEETTEE